MLDKIASIVCGELFDLLDFFAVGLARTQTAKATREAAYALHALLTETMGQC
jgi:hypothetical protein